MSIFFNNLKTGTSILALAIFIYTVFLAIIRPKLREKNKLLFRLLCAVPVLACAVHFYFCYFRGKYGIFSTINVYKYLYMAAFLPLLLMLPADKKLPRRLLSVFTSIAVFISSMSLLITEIEFSKVHNFTTLGWSDGFKKTVEVMSEEYVLSDWKEIDYDALLDEYLPQIEEAEKKRR